MKLSEKLAAMVEFHPGQKFPNTTLVPVVAMALQKWAGEAYKLESDNAAMRTALGPLARLADLYEREAFEGQFAYLAAIGCKRARDVIEEVRRD